MRNIEDQRVQLKDENEIIQSQMMSSFCELETVIRQGREEIDKEYKRQNQILETCTNTFKETLKNLSNNVTNRYDSIIQSVQSLYHKEQKLFKLCYELTTINQNIV